MFRKYCRVILVLLVSLLVSGFAAADEIRDIRVEGLERLSPGMVFNHLPIKVGDRFEDIQTAEAVRALFQTGLFKDVGLERDESVLVVVVVEREAIAAIEITGNKDIKTEPLKEGIAQIGLAQGEVFDESLLDRAVQELKRQYFSLGRYGVEIETEVESLGDNRVLVALHIDEGATAHIKQINIVGNSVFSDQYLLRKIDLTSKKWNSFFSRSSQYSRQKLSGDLEIIRSLYLDSGYINFVIDSTQVSITPDRRDVYITVNVTEGDLFTVSEVRLTGNLIVAQTELFPLVETLTGSRFSRKGITQTTTNITDRLGNEGYAFANVNAIPQIDKQAKKVAITYAIDPGKRVNVRRVNFTGNTKTRDEVLRREMRQMEGGWMSTEKVERSKVRLQRLGYFEEVNVETPAAAGVDDQVDVDFAVEERPSGNLLLGLGFSQTQGVIFNTSVTQDNFLGSGKRVNFAFNNSEVNRRFALGYTNPYWTVNGVSRGFNGFYRETNAGNANVTRFESKVLGGGVNLGIPVTEFQTVNLAANYERTDIDPNSFAATEVLRFVASNGNEFDVVRLRGNFAYDTRNRAVLPDRGVLHSVRVQVAAPPGDLRFFKLDYDTRWFFPLWENYTLLLKGNLGYGDSYGRTSELPFFENFFAGGPRSVRGYEENTLGPRDSSGRPIGGDTRVIGNAEVILPLPFLSDLESVRVTGFLDAGNVYGPGDDFDLSELRLSSGLSGIWLSPFGVLSVSVGLPLNDTGSDQTQPFQFTFGTSF